jgi:cell division protein FtsQ
MQALGALQSPGHDLPDLDNGQYHEFEPVPATARAPRRGTGRFVRLLAGALIAGLAVGAAIEGRQIADGHLPEVDRLARVMGFGIDQVTLRGHRFSFDRDIFDALDLANVRSFAALDTAAVKARIERLPWIDTAEITRVYPGQLEIRVTERKPFALWTRGERRYVIDKTGRVLAAVSGETLPNLPRVAGEGAADKAAEIFDLVARFPEIGKRLEEAERVSERRWNLKLKGAVTVKLPADGEARILDRLSREAEMRDLLAQDNTIVDMRAPGRVAVRRDAPPAEASAQPGTGS